MQITEKVSMINLIGTQQIIRVKLKLNWIRKWKIREKWKKKKKKKLLRKIITDKCHFFLIFFIPELTLFHVQCHFINVINNYNDIKIYIYLW